MRNLAGKFRGWTLVMMVMFPILTNAQSAVSGKIIANATSQVVPGASVTIMQKEPFISMRKQAIFWSLLALVSSLLSIESILWEIN
jgi:hypothetical protein